MAYDAGEEVGSAWLGVGIVAFSKSADYVDHTFGLTRQSLPLLLAPCG